MTRGNCELISPPSHHLLRLSHHQPLLDIASESVDHTDLPQGRYILQFAASEGNSANFSEVVEVPVIDASL